jgi:hypothetical protein
MLTLAVGLLAGTALPVLSLATPSGAVPPPAPQLTVSPNPVVFAPTTVGDFSDAIDVTLTNVGSAPDTLTGDSYTGADPTTSSPSRSKRTTTTAPLTTPPAS